MGGLANITSEEAERLVVAYEPVWAIGTGKVPTPGDIERAIRAIRSQIKHLFGDKTAKAVRVLYGGSVDDQIIRGYLEIPGVDGALVGGASLHAHKFAGMVEAARRLQVEREG